MMWGKTLNTLVKRAIDLVEDAKKQYPEVHLNVHVCWFGNELVGEAGIAQNPPWPFDGPNGHWPDLQADCLRHLRWFRQKCRDFRVQSAGLTTAPNSANYGINLIFDQFYDALEAQFAGDIQLPDGMPDPRFCWLSAVDYASDLEFKDQWHFANSDENRLRLASYWTATMFLLDMAWDLNQVYDALQRLPQRSCMGRLPAKLEFYLRTKPSELQGQDHEGGEGWFFARTKSSFVWLAAISRRRM